MGPIVKLLVGLVAAPVVLATIAIAIPHFPSDLERPTREAWLWTPGSPLVRVPLHHPLEDMEIRTAADGTIYAVREWDAQLERYDAHKHAFVDAPGVTGSVFANPPIYPEGPGFIHVAMGGDAWIAVPRNGGVTGIYRQQPWEHGPSIPDGYPHHAAIVAPDVIAVGETGTLYVARLGDESFVARPYAGPEADLIVAHDAMLLTVTRADDLSSVTVHAIDPATGQTTDGPSLPIGSFVTSTAITGVGVGFVGSGAKPQERTGGLLFCVSTHGRGYNVGWLLPNLIAAALLPLEYLALRSLFRRMPTKHAFWVGFLLATVVIAVLGASMLIAAYGLAHM